MNGRASVNGRGMAVASATRWVRLGALACVAVLQVGCAAAPHPADLAWVDASGREAGPAIAVRWSRPLVVGELRSASVPVQQAAPAIDAARGRVFVGSTRGELLAFSRYGRELYRVAAPAAIEAMPTVDGAKSEVYVATVTGDLLALNGDTGSERWRAQLGGASSKPGLLRDDALYLVTDNDIVLALSRKDGSVLWRHRRERPDAIAIAGHAGLSAAGHRILTAFGDGVVAALDAGDGRVLWETDTSVDLDLIDENRRFIDVDTTPAVAGDLVFAASFAGGLYGLELDSGTVAHHDARMTGVTGLVATQDALVVSSADQGLVCFDLPAMTVRWRHEIARGAPSEPVVEDGTVYLVESRGALLALSVADGHELGRVETEHGLTPNASLSKGFGAALSNGGTIYAFRYGR